MKGDGRRIVRVLATLGVSLAAACSPPSADRPAGGAPAAVEEAGNAMELECEVQLARLDGLISTRRAEPGFPRARIAEASALRDAATTLYAEGEYRLALDLMGEAITLLGKT